MGLTTLDYLIVCWWEAVAMVLRRRQNSVGKRNFLSLQLRTVPLALEGRKDDGPFVSALLLLSFASLTQTLNSPVVWWRKKIKNKAQRRFFGRGFSRASINHWVANFRSWWSGHCSTHLFHHITRQQRPKECWWCALYSSDAGSKLSGYYITRSGGKMDPGPGSINGQSTCNGFSLGSACHAVCSPFFFSFLEIFNSSKIAVSNFYPEFVMGCQLDLYKIEFHYYIIVGRLECVYIV